MARTSLLLLLATLLVAPSLHAKKKDRGLKKIVAIGQVDAGSVYIPSMGRNGLNDLFKDLLKKKLEKTGRYVVVFAQKGTGKKATSQKTPTIPQPPKGGTYTPQQAAQLMAQAQQMMQQFSLSGMGGMASDYPVAAQALFRLVVRSSESSTDTGGAVGMAEVFSGTDLGVADFSSESKKIAMTCTQHDTEDGRLADHYRTKATAVQFHRLAGMTHYSYNNYDEFERALDKNAKKALGKIAKWIDKKMKARPWEGQVFKKQGLKIFLNAGASAGIQPGMSFHVFKREAVSGRGVQLGSEEQAVGRIEVIDVKENYAVANTSTGMAEVGSIVRPASTVTD